MKFIRVRKEANGKQLIYPGHSGCSIITFHIFSVYMLLFLLFIFILVYIFIHVFIYLLYYLVIDVDIYLFIYLFICAFTNNRVIC